MPSTYLRDRYTNLSSLTVVKDSSINRQKVLELADFYVLMRPRVEGPLRADPQSIDLSTLGWKKDEVLHLAKRTLFDKGVETVNAGDDFSRVARSKGYYADKRIVEKKTSALLLQDGRPTIDRGVKHFAESESIANCLFRHVRNSIAHGNIFRLPYQRILLLDKTESKAFSAYIITTPKRLYRFMAQLKAGH